MKSLDKEYNERFQHAKVSNDDFDVEGLWDNIEEELEERKRRPIFFYITGVLGLALLLFSIIGIGFWAGSTHSEGMREENAIAKYESLDSTIKSANITIKEKPSILEDNSSHEKVGKKVIVQRNNNSEKNQNISNSSNETYNKVIDAKLNELKNTKSATNIAQTDLEKDSKIEKPSINKKTKVKEQSQLNVEQNSKAITSKRLPLTHENALLAVEQIDSRQLFIEFSNRIPEQIGIASFRREIADSGNEEKTDVPRKSKITLGIHGGVNWTSQKYKYTEDSFGEAIKNDTESGEFGQNYGLDITFALNDRWIIKSGVEYHKTWTVFDYTDVQVNQVLRENQLLRVWVDGADTLRYEYGNSMVNRTTTQEIVHHNQYNRITIPLEFGINKKAKI